MKNWLIFTTFLAFHAHLEASYLHKALRAAVPVTTATIAGLQLNTIHDHLKRKNTPLEAEKEGWLLFGEKTQQKLREHFKADYPLTKPLTFGVHQIGNNAFAASHLGTNYLLFGYELLPKSPFTTTELPKRKAHESDDEFDQRWKHFYKAQDENHRNHMEFLRNPPSQELIEKLKDIAFISKHEIGHLVYDHANKNDNYFIQLLAQMTLVNTLVGGYITRSVYKNHISKVGLIGRIGAIAALAQAASVYVLYKKNAQSRFHESQADDFAIQHATSKQELQDAAAFFKKHSDELKDQSNKSPIILQVFNNYFPTHPTPESRIEKLQ